MDRKLADLTERMARHAILITAAAIMIVPIYYIVIMSFKSVLTCYEESGGLSPPKLIPFLQFEPTLIGYTTLPKKVDQLYLAYGNSVIVAIASSSIGVFFGLIGGYSLSRYKFSIFGRWKNDDIGFLFIVMQMLPPALSLIPYFVAFAMVGLIDTLLALILVHTGMHIPFVVWMSKGFFDQIPREIEEAAYIDGSALIRTMGLITIPLAAPGIVTIWLLCFMGSWNEFLYAMMLTRENAVVLPVVAAGQSTDLMICWWNLSALCTLMLIPPIVFSFFVQKYIIQGLTLGAVKG